MTTQDDEISALIRHHNLSEEEATILWYLRDIYRDLYDQVTIQLGRDGWGGGNLADAAASITSQWDWDSASDPPPRLPRESVTTLLECLEVPSVAQAMLSEIHAMPASPTLGIALGTFSDWARSITAPRAHPAMLWLRAAADVLLGAVPAAEADLQTAESLDPEWPLALEELARFASDRGDRDRALELLRRAYAPDGHPLLETLKLFEPQPRTDISRNDPCWCGSGRHYKKCHMRHEQLSLDDRADWLYRKAVAAMLDYPWYTKKVVEVAVVHRRRMYADTLDDVVFDVVLSEGGAFNDFLTQRGYLLPSDELRLAEQWQHVKRSVHQVVSVHRGEGVTVRDLRTDEVSDVRERAGSLQMKVGSFYCARTFPAGETVLFFGGVEPVSSAQCRRLLDVLDSNPDPIEALSR